MDKVSSAEDIAEYRQFCCNGRSGVFVRPSDIENRVIRIGRNPKTLAPSSKFMFSHWSLKWRYSQHAYEKVRAVQRAFTHSEIVL
jgi:hypothetical protein